MEFKIYKYAVFNSVARKQTDSEGKTSCPGKGDSLHGLRKRDFRLSKSFWERRQVTLLDQSKAGDFSSLNWMWCILLMGLSLIKD
jgi:hypothetical protein